MVAKITTGPGKTKISTDPKKTRMTTGPVKTRITTGPMKTRISTGQVKLRISTDENNLIRHFYQNAFFTNKILFTIIQNQREIINNLRFVSEIIGVRGGVTCGGAGSMGEESIGFGGLNVSTDGRMGNGSVRLETVGGLSVPTTGGIGGESLGLETMGMLNATAAGGIVGGSVSLGTVA